MGVPARLMVLLTAVAGGVDAAAFIELDEVFVANQTGNGVLLAVGIADSMLPGHAAEGVLGPAASLLGFCVGGVATAWASRLLPHWALLGFEAGLLVLAAGLAWAPSALCAGVLASAMGAQSVYAVRAGVPGVTTTVVTGTLAALFVRATGGTRERQGAPLLALVWLAYFVGALGGAAVVLA
ncbi:DUF1275 family protein [Streptomyces sp. NPDC127098]|uniref:DUF1275 family protein n=1 Tax=Streptomyces sp. NPDC127098 TaxID=3347137 RepID=UPI00365FCBF0